MKVGTDGVLLGAWASVAQRMRILDVGTGSGLIALMLAQRTESNSASIMGIEIDRLAFEQALDNSKNSPWSDRVAIQHLAFEQFVENVPRAKLDLIVCNPPYFDCGTAPADSRRMAARNSKQLDRKSLFAGAIKLLSESGILSVVLPFEQYEESVALAQQFDLHEARTTFVRPTPGQAFKRVLIEFGFEKRETVNEEFFVETSRHQYSDEFAELLGDFYLRYA